MDILFCSKIFGIFIFISDNVDKTIYGVLPSFFSEFILLDKYSSDKSIDLKDTKVLELKPFDEFGNPLKIVKAFGGKKKYIEAIKELEKEIYA